MKRAQGFQPIRHFAHKAKVRRNARHITDLQAKQTLELTAWNQLSNSKQSVDKFRAGWQGFIVYSAMVFDGRPRLRRTSGNG